MATKKTTSDPIVYQLKITLEDIRPPIWRRVQVLSTTTLHQLHLIIQEVMDWENCHLHQFSIEGIDYSEPNPDYDSDMLSTRNVKLSKVIKGEKFKFSYVYDFGDSWEHQILVEKELPVSPEVQYPICIKGKRACPPEDCGGVWGYANLLEIIADPSHPEYEEMIEWVGDESYDPDFFDIERVNNQLTRFCKSSSTKKRGFGG